MVDDCVFRKYVCVVSPFGRFVCTCSPVWYQQVWKLLTKVKQLSRVSLSSMFLFLKNSPPKSSVISGDLLQSETQEKQNETKEDVHATRFELGTRPLRFKSPNSECDGSGNQKTFFDAPIRANRGGKPDILLASVVSG